MALRELNDVLLQFLHEVILQKGINKTVTAINERFQLRDHYIEAAHIFVFDETPSALLEIFVLLAKNPHIEGLRGSTFRLIRESRHLIDAGYSCSHDNG